MLMRAIGLGAVSAALSISVARAGVVCTAVSDAATGKFLRQEGICDKRVTPASTFKIAISLMGYDSGFLTGEHVPALPFHEGYPDWSPAWRTTTDPTSWIKNSVVWYSQQITQWLGEERFRRYVVEFHYGNEDVSGDAGKHDGLTRAWLSSSLKISPLEQLSFLQAIVGRQLPVTAHAYDMTSRITAVAALPSGWDVHGKTGTGFPIKADGTDDLDHAFGWFVGWATKAGRTSAFARLIQDDKQEAVYPGLRARDAFIAELPSILESP
jgi:beta-lactamase class D